MISIHGKRLVIFGCGYVGSALAREALVLGARVVALTRNLEQAATLRAGGVEVVVGDLSSGDWHREIGHGPDFAVNCVSGGDGPEGYRRSYVAGMQSILAWAAAAAEPVGTLVYTSSTSVYPQGGGLVVDESAPTGDGPFNGRVILESESLLRAALPTVIGRSFVLRLAGIYGPGRHPLLNQLRAGGQVLTGDPMHRMNLAHRDDIVGAILACLTAPAAIGSSVFNVADGAPAPRAEVGNWLAAQLGVPAPHFETKVGGARRGGEPVPDRVISSARIQQTLGWRPHFSDYRSGYADILRHG